MLIGWLRLKLLSVVAPPHPHECVGQSLIEQYISHEDSEEMHRKARETVRTRLADRISLFERWRSAAAPSRSNGQRAHANGHAAAAHPGPAPDAGEADRAASVESGRSKVHPNRPASPDKELTLR
jgi:hypothetical protein